MQKEIKKFGKILEIILIFLTFISLIINAFAYTNALYNGTYDTMKLNAFLSTTFFESSMWIVNILIYLVGLFYIIDTIQQKKDLLLKLSFCLFSICTTIVFSPLIINGIAKIFGIL